MSYKTYITDALVCGSRLQNTADKSYLLFTREAGMIFATAKSVREERSKHRYALQEFSLIRATLVSGKGGWRITGAEPIVNTFSIQTTRESRALVRNTVRLIRRLMRGEVSHPELFDEVRAVLSEPHVKREAKIEEVLTLRLLYMLGYVAPTSEIAPLLENRPVNAIVHTLELNTTNTPRMLIERALRESHL